MPSTLDLIHVDGVPTWRDAVTGWSAPVIAGGDGEGDGGGDDGGDAPAATVTSEGTFVPPENPPAQPAKTERADDLGDAGKAALDAERTARKTAEKQARELTARLKKLEDADMSETDRLKREAEDGKALAAKAGDMLQRANLMSALSEQGFTGARAKAVSKLLDGVEYDDDHEPTNLSAALKRAEKEYGDLVKATPAVTNFDGGARSTAPSGSMDDAIRRAAGRQR